MPGYRGHLAGAGASFAPYFALVVGILMLDAAYARAPAYARFSTLELVGCALALFALTLLFGLWPDVDTDSKGRRVFYRLFLVADLVLILNELYMEAAYFGLFAMLPSIDHHRGWTHSWWAMLLVPAPLVALPFVYVPARPLVGLPFYGAAVVGYFSHLYMDGIVRAWWRRRRA